MVGSRPLADVQRLLQNGLLGRLAFGIIVITAMMPACSEQPIRKTSAVVTDIAPRVSRWRTDEVLVTVRSEDGLIGSEFIEEARLTCRLGDKVRALVRGVALSLDGRTCHR